jgi:hypothetical protein
VRLKLEARPRPLARQISIASVGVSPPNVFLGLAKTKRQAPPLFFFFAASFAERPFCELRIANSESIFSIRHSPLSYSLTAIARALSRAARTTFYFVIAGLDPTIHAAGPRLNGPHTNAARRHGPPG